MDYIGKSPVCEEKRSCFAQRLRVADQRIHCTLLTEVYEEGKCPFCKPFQNITKGKEYPYNLTRCK